MGRTGKWSTVGMYFIGLRSERMPCSRRARFQQMASCVGVCVRAGGNKLPHLGKAHAGDGIRYEAAMDGGLG
jgi:hypothetical protein